MGFESPDRLRTRDAAHNKEDSRMTHYPPTSPEEWDLTALAEALDQVGGNLARWQRYRLPNYIDNAIAEIEYLMPNSRIAQALKKAI